MVVVLYLLVQISWLQAVLCTSAVSPALAQALSAEYPEMTAYCRRCDQFKAPRVHHCSVCRKCTLLMDHHCPWIMNCVGYGNGKMFALFLFYLCFSCVWGVVAALPVAMEHYSIMKLWFIDFIALDIRWYDFPFMGFLFGYVMLVAVLVAVMMAVMLIQFLSSIWSGKGSIIDRFTLSQSALWTSPHYSPMELVFGKNRLLWLVPMLSVPAPEEVFLRPAGNLL